MLEIIREFGRDGAVLLLGLSVGAAWITAIVAPNASYDNLSANQAEKHVRELLKSASDPIAVLLFVAAGLGILGGAVVSGILALVAAIGFFTNRWILKSFKSDSGKEEAPGKTQRILAVSLTLLFGLAAAAAAVLAVLGI
ncbi:MAG: hypothetical protein AAFQ15_02810 [Pseudomonadota bacterium]